MKKKIISRSKDWRYKVIQRPFLKHQGLHEEELPHDRCSFYSLLGKALACRIAMYFSMAVLSVHLLMYLILSGYAVVSEWSALMSGDLPAVVATAQTYIDMWLGEYTLGWAKSTTLWASSYISPTSTMWVDALAITAIGITAIIAIAYVAIPALIIVTVGIVLAICIIICLVYPFFYIKETWFVKTAIRKVLTSKVVSKTGYKVDEANDLLHDKFCALVEYTD